MTLIMFLVQNKKKLSGNGIGIKVDEDPLATEQNSYVVKILTFKLKNCLFGATNILESTDKEKWVYSGYGIIFDVACLWDLTDDFARNVSIFGVDNSSSSRINC